MTAPVTKRLIDFSHGAGCGCKLGLAELTDVLDRLTPQRHPDLLVGGDTGDDAAVWRLDTDRALVLTTDFFTPIVDDARDWGRIAATNAASDVYAMGGEPLLALNIVAWNPADLPMALLGDVLEGASEVAEACGFLIVGGHTIDDPEPKYGLAVVGEAHPDRLLSNAGLRPGDALVLTKPVGTGVVTTAAKLGRAGAPELAAAVESMTLPNSEGARVALDAGATGATDVTGFGLLGHLARMAGASQVDVRLQAGDVPLLPCARELAAAGAVPGGTRRNLDWVRSRLDGGAADGTTLLLLADAQTSGGLLFGATPAEAERAVSRLIATGHRAAVVGAVTRPGSGRVTIEP